MKITPVMQFYVNGTKRKPVSSFVNTLSAPYSKGADFYFKGKFEDTACIIPASKPTDLEYLIKKNTQLPEKNTEVKKFKNGETYVRINGDLNGKDVYIMPVAGENVNDNLMETYLKADAAKRAGAKKVIAVTPNYPYARQERRDKQGEPISARLNMDLLKTSGVDEIITSDLHTSAIEGFAANSMKVTHLESMPLISEYIKEKNIPNMVIVSPDLGGTKRVDKLAKELNCDKAIIYKHRQAHNEATAEDLIGDVTGKNCIIYDDIIDTAGTIAEASKLLKNKGAEKIYVCAAHGLFNGDAFAKLDNAPIEEVIVTNSVQAKDNQISKIRQLDISTQITETMKKISG